MNINKEIKRLINYGINSGLIEENDSVYVTNRIIEILKLDCYEDTTVENELLESPQPILDNLLDFAHQQGILEDNTITYRDILDTKIMDCLMPRPSEVIGKFQENYKQSPQKATEVYYKMSMASNYIRTERTKKDLKWDTFTDFGRLEITINLSKPEKDPKAIAASKNMKSSGYPKCLLCIENEGYAGHVNHPARHNHRIIPLNLRDESWCLQYSPYVYYQEHSIIFKSSHEPMKISQKTFERLLAFVEKFPHYFIGSNADLPIVGGSILSHDHFQGGNHKFAMEKAPIISTSVVKGFEEVEVGMVKWPLSVVRLRGEQPDRLTELGGIILDKWRNYSDESVGILSHTDGEPHNTITPIARFANGKYELDLVLRNNRTNQLHPDGIFHPHSDVHHIKRENVGLIEVMGLAVLPGRLKVELELLKECLLGINNIEEFEELEKHKNWYLQLKEKYSGDNVDFDQVLKYEVGKIFERILIDAGVFKQTPVGIEAFQRFVNFI